MRAIQFMDFGEPEEVLRLSDAPEPEVRPGEIAVAVHCVALNPADWASVGGFSAEVLAALPRGIGCEGSGTVDEIGSGVTGVAIGDRVFGAAAQDRRAPVRPSARRSRTGRRSRLVSACPRPLR